MVVRVKRSSRKHLGNRRWGAGNIKNNRGSGCRGGVGRGGRKHKFTYRVKYEPETIGNRGFHTWGSSKAKQINLGQVSVMLSKSADPKPTVELRGYKVLGAGTLARPGIIKASGFSKSALARILSGGGEAVVF
jgi:large subunit ribosomal protein L15